MSEAMSPGNIALWVSTTLDNMVPGEDTAKVRARFDPNPLPGKASVCLTPYPNDHKAIGEEVVRCLHRIEPELLPAAISLRLELLDGSGGYIGSRSLRLVGWGRLNGQTSPSSESPTVIDAVSTESRSRVTEPRLYDQAERLPGGPALMRIAEDAAEGMTRGLPEQVPLSCVKLLVATHAFYGCILNDQARVTMVEARLMAGENRMLAAVTRESAKALHDIVMQRDETNGELMGLAIKGTAQAAQADARIELARIEGELEGEETGRAAAANSKGQGKPSAMAEGLSMLKAGAEFINTARTGAAEAEAIRARTAAQKPAEAPKTETPKPEEPKAEPPKAEVPKAAEEPDFLSVLLQFPPAMAAAMLKSKLTPEQVKGLSAIGRELAQDEATP